MLRMLRVRTRSGVGIVGLPGRQAGTRRRSTVLDLERGQLSSDAFGIPAESFGGDGGDRLGRLATEVGSEAQHQATEHDVTERLCPLDGDRVGDLGAQRIADRQQRQRPPGVGVGDGADLAGASAVDPPQAVGIGAGGGRRLRGQGQLADVGVRQRVPIASVEQLVDDLGGDRAPGGQLAAGDRGQAGCAVASVVDQEMPPRDAVGEAGLRG